MKRSCFRFLTQSLIAAALLGSVLGGLSCSSNRPISQRDPEIGWGEKGEAPVEAETWGKWDTGWIIMSQDEYFRSR